MSNFKLRCSAIGQILPSKKARTRFTKTQTDWIKKRLIEAKYNRIEEIKSEFLTKGIEVEEEGFTLACKVLKLGFVTKNKEQSENDYISGTPDLIMKDCVIDTKNSWNLFTFPFFEKEIPNIDYWWQLQGYMALTGLKKAKLVYCLVNTPEHLILREGYRLAIKRGVMLEDVEEEVRSLHTFGDIPEIERVKVYDIDRNDEAINEIYSRVQEIREYIDSLKLDEPHKI